MKVSNLKCPVCLSIKNRLFSQDKFRSYYLCDECDLVYVPRDELLSSVQEKERYDLHDNVNSVEYLKYLSLMMDNILPFISKKNVGLDFGCGALTALSEIFQKKEIHLDSFDLYYHPNHSIWNCKYDFIIISEVIEHLHNPEDTMTSLKKILNPNGKIFIKTKFRKESIEFANWFYKRDLTHIQFFNPKSLELFANRLGFAFSEIGPDLYLWN